MKRVVKIVLLISFLVAVFIFASPWLYYWAAPVVEWFSDEKTKLYVYDVNKGEKALVYTQRGLTDFYPFYYDSKNNKIYFIKSLTLFYIIPSLGVDVKRDKAVLGYINLTDKTLKKLKTLKNDPATLDNFPLLKEKFVNKKPRVKNLYYYKLFRERYASKILNNKDYQPIVQYGDGNGFIPFAVERKLKKPTEIRSMGAEHVYSSVSDLYLFDGREKKLISIDKSILMTSPAVAWNDAGDKMLYVVRN